MGIPVTSDEEFDLQFEQMDETGLGKIEWESFSNFLSGADDDRRKAKSSSLIESENGEAQLSLESISTINKLFEENKVHSSAWGDGHLNQEVQDEYLLDLTQLRAKLLSKEVVNQVSLDVFNSFFGQIA